MQEQKYSRLRWKIVATTLAFSLIPLLSLGLFIYFQFSTTYTDKIASNLRTILENKKRAIDQLIEEKIAQIRIVAQTHSFEQLSDQGYLRQVFAVVQANSKLFVDIGIIAEDGRHVAYVGPYKLTEVNYRDEPWFHEVMLRGLYVSDVFMGFRQFPHFIIAVKRQEGEQGWILRVSVDQDVFNNLVQSVQVGRQGDAYLVNSQNILQTASRFDGPPLTPSRLPAHTYFTGVRVETTGDGGEGRLMGLTWLDNAKWMLVIVENPIEEMSPLISSQRNVVLITLLGMLIIITGTCLTAEATVRKIAEVDREAALLDASLMHSSKMAALGKLAAGVAHEVNNPLTLIRESAGWIKDLLADEDPAKIENFEEIAKAVERIDQNVERAKGVTHRMLGFGRRMEPTQENVNINLLVEETLKFLENEAHHRNIAFIREFMPHPPLLSTDPSQLQQVFLNILDNAIDAIDHDGTVTIHTGLTESGREFAVIVHDTGVGIPKDKLEKIFDPFYTTKKVGEGTGLGLSIVYGIIEKLGGRIEADSEVGKGSTFTVFLPLG
jgi:two-component system NtrC family sensor kinase